MKELKICSVSDAYICYLRAKIPNVYSNKDQNRTGDKELLGTLRIIHMIPVPDS